MFAFGALPAILIFYIRRYVDEPEVSVRSRAIAEKKGTQPSIWEIFSPAILKTTLLTAIFSAGAQGGYYAVTTWVPTFLRAERGLTVVGSTGYLATVIVGSFVGYLVGGWLADRIGRRKLFFTFSIGAILLVLVYTQMPISNAVMLFVGFPLGFFASGYYSGIGPFFSELFPTRLRGSGQGFAFNFGRGIGALFPTLVGYMSSTMSLAHAIAIFAVTAYGLLFLATLMLPETRGKALLVDE